jgi:O-acetyl-ADP-ribose deacetylase (regulator of RNase III)
VAFPALGTGVGSFPIHEAARVMIEATCTYLRSSPHNLLKRIVFVLFTPETLQAFEQALAEATK